MSDTSRSPLDRRQFVKSAALGAAATFAAPAILTAKKPDSEVILGEGDYQYRVTHNWAQLPSPFEWLTTHNVCVDRDGNVYIVHEGRDDRRDHPAVFVFDHDGKYIRSFGNVLAGGAHGMDLRDEGGEQFLYVTSYRPKLFAKYSLKGEEVWRRHAPMESGKYAAGEDVDNHVYGERDNFMPTNFAFLPNGDFWVADGYGAFWIHRYDKDANWLGCFGGPGDGDGQFASPHGLWLDNRPGREPAVAITDRSHRKVKYFSLDGEYLSTLEDCRLPCNFDTFGELMVMPDLDGRVTLLDKDNKTLAHLGNDDAWRKQVDEGKLRKKPDSWRPDRFVHPHDTCFDLEGNLIITEWVEPGRVIKLTRIT